MTIYSPVPGSESAGAPFNHVFLYTTQFLYDKREEIQ